MQAPRKVHDVLRRLTAAKSEREPVPAYEHNDARENRAFLALESFQRHMTDEGWQLQIGLQAAGYTLWGRGFGGMHNCGDVDRILRRSHPGVVFVQDKREWDPDSPACLDLGRAFHNLEALRNCPDVFRITVHKDLQNRPDYQRAFHQEMGAHACVVYYHPEIATHLCPWLRPQHLIRTYHTVDRERVPAFNAGTREACLFSGAVGSAYPLRQRIAKWVETAQLRTVSRLTHPGYHSSGTSSNEYLQTLSGYKVAICTSSRYGYSLRKIVEATAAGCVVITDLPSDDVLPEIDDNLIRIHPDISLQEFKGVLRHAESRYNNTRQKEYAQRCLDYYDYRVMGQKLFSDIEVMRRNWSNIAEAPQEKAVVPHVSRARPVTVVVNRNYRPRRR